MSFKPAETQTLDVIYGQSLPYPTYDLDLAHLLAHRGHFTSRPVTPLTETFHRYLFTWLVGRDDHHLIFTFFCLGPP